MSRYEPVAILKLEKLLLIRMQAFSSNDRERYKNKVNQAELRRAEEQLLAANRGGGLVDGHLKKTAKTKYVYSHQDTLSTADLDTGLIFNL